MNLENDIQPIMTELLAGSEFSAAQLEMLRRQISHQPSESTAFADQLVIHRLLQHHYQTGPSSREHFTGEVLGRLQPPAMVTPAFTDHVLQRVVTHSRRWQVAAAAIILGISLMVFFISAPLPAARLMAGTGLVWANGDAWNVGHHFRAGSYLELEAGFAEIRFAQGAEVVLEGSAKLEIISANAALLRKGNIVARVPESAHGFTIIGPQGKVVDLGTEFAVRADDAGMEVHVLEGQVEAHPEGSAMISLTKDHALRLDHSGVTTIAPEFDQFLTALPPAFTASASWLHWSFDEGFGNSVTPTGVGLPLADSRGELRSLPGGNEIPRWTQGVRGSGIQFLGKDDFIQTTYQGVSGHGPRTVACWVQVPQDMTTHGFALVSWGAHQSPGDTWQLSINPLAHEGPVGRLRVGTHQGQVIGVKDLRDGAWHHVAAVMYEGHVPDVSTHVLLYVDGELEPAACKSVRTINTNTSGADAQRVSFGKNSAVRRVEDEPQWYHTFRGLIDEITICETALSEAEIRHLMRHGPPF
jgi:hypothetical protein